MSPSVSFTTERAGLVETLESRNLAVLMPVPTKKFMLPVLKHVVFAVRMSPGTPLHETMEWLVRAIGLLKKQYVLIGIAMIRRNPSMEGLSEMDAQLHVVSVNLTSLFLPLLHQV